MVAEAGKVAEKQMVSNVGRVLGNSLSTQTPGEKVSAQHAKKMLRKAKRLLAKAKGKDGAARKLVGGKKHKQSQKQMIRTAVKKAVAAVQKVRSHKKPKHSLTRGDTKLIEQVVSKHVQGKDAIRKAVKKARKAAYKAAKHAKMANPAVLVNEMKEPVQAAKDAAARVKHAVLKKAKGKKVKGKRAKARKARKARRALRQLGAASDALHASVVHHRGMQTPISTLRTALTKALGHDLRKILRKIKRRHAKNKQLSLHEHRQVNQKLREMAAMVMKKYSDDEPAKQNHAKKQLAETSEAVEPAEKPAPTPVQQFVSQALPEQPATKQVSNLEDLLKFGVHLKTGGVLHFVVPK